MDYKDMKFRMWNGCDRGLCCKAVGRQDRQLNTYDWLADVPGNAESTDLVEVQFKNTRKAYYHNVNNLDLKKGDVVAVEASPGHDIGVVTLTGRLVKLQIKKANLKSADDIKRIYRIAKPVDIEKCKEAKSREHGTMIQSRQIAKDLGLKMKIGDVEYQGDGNKAIFYYIADERVDFRQLIKVLADTFHVRIEMKQIGARQEAGRIGGTGPCGRELCCATWMKNFVSVSTNAARFQDISLNPQKLAGMCAKLKCCLNYEVDNYSSDKNMASNLETITAERAQEIIAMNRQGEKPLSLLEDGKVKEKPKSADLLAEADLSRFDKAKRKKKNNKNRSKAVNGENAQQQNTPQQPNADISNTASAPEERDGNRENRRNDHRNRRQRPQRDNRQQGDRPQRDYRQQGERQQRGNRPQRDRNYQKGNGNQGNNQGENPSHNPVNIPESNQGNNNQGGHQE